MKLLIVLSFLLQSAFASRKPDFAFQCNSIELKEDVNVHVEMFEEFSDSPIGRTISRRWGWMTVTAPDFKDKIKVLYHPNYSKFSLRAYPDDETIESRKDKFKFNLETDTRVWIEKNPAAGNFEIKFPDARFDKWISYKLICNPK